MRKVFIDFGYHKITIFFNVTFTLANCFGMSLVLHFTIKNFNKDLIIRYAPSLIILVYVSKIFDLLYFVLVFVRLRLQMITSMIVAILLEKEILQLVNEHQRLFWSINSAGSQARLFILKKASKINRYTYFMYTVAALWSIVMLPVFGSHREWLIVEDVFDQYLGSSSKIVSQIFFSFAPVIVYSALRHIGILLYNILQLCLQISLINEHVLQISDDKTVLEKLSFAERLRLQNQIFKKLCFCIEHHVVVTR
jgi:hypothetical protein